MTELMTLGGKSADIFKSYIAGDADLKRAALANPEYMAAIMSEINHDEIKEFSRKAKDLARLDWSELKGEFLSRTASRHTRRGYENALAKYERFCERRSAAPLALTYATADRFLRELKSSGFSAATVRRDCAALSSFFSFLERDTGGKVSNSFRGTKERPRKEPKRQNHFWQIEKITAENVADFAADFEAMRLAAASPELKLAIYLMYRRGFRAGAFEKLTVRAGGDFRTESKGKEFEGTLDGEAMKEVDESGLDKKNLFVGWNAAKIETYFYRLACKLYERGAIKHRYSCHDLRHYFAIRFYLETKDIYALKQLLNHASIGITETYLKGLKVLQ